jgi:hypothetical protein
MVALFANNAFSTLNAGITSVATSLTVASGDGALFPSPTGSGYFYATLINTANTLEIVKCTSRSSDVLTIVREQEGTTGTGFSTGDRIELRVTAAGLTELGDMDSTNNLSDVAVAATSATNLGLGTGNKPAFAGATLSADLTFSGADPEVQGGDTNGVLIISPNTNALGAVVKQYGDTHASKAGDFEFYDDTTLVANYDASASKWFFKGIDYTIFDIAGHYGDELDDGLTPIVIVSNTGFGFTIDSMTYDLSAGAITANLQIAGVSVTSLSALSVTTTEQTTAATGANTVAAGVDVTMVLTAITTADRNFSFTIHCTRTS